MSLIAVPRQRQTQFNDRNAEISGSSSTSLKTAGIKKWKSLTRKKESKKESSPPLRQASLAIDIDTANNVPYDDIDGLTDLDCTQSLRYSPELAAIVSTGGRSKRWAFCLTPTPADFEQNNEFSPDHVHEDRDKGDMTDRRVKSEEEGYRRPTTLYLILDPDQDPSNSSEVRMLVGTREELRSKTGGGDELEKGL